MRGCEEGPAFLRLTPHKAHHGPGAELHEEMGGNKSTEAEPEPAHKRLLPVRAASRLLCNVTGQQPAISAKDQCVYSEHLLYLGGRVHLERPTSSPPYPPPIFSLSSTQLRLYGPQICLEKNWGI